VFNSTARAYGAIAIVTTGSNNVSETDQNNESPKWIELARIEQGSFESRRALEWKLAFGFWTGISVFTAAVFTYAKFPLPTYIQCVLALLYFVLWIVSINFWQIPIHESHAKGRERFHEYMRRAQRIVPKDKTELNEYPAENTDWRTTGSYQWYKGQCWFTFIFLLLSWIIITQIPAK
jgi:hypothetical protein